MTASTPSGEPNQTTGVAPDTETPDAVATLAAQLEAVQAELTQLREDSLRERAELENQRKRMTRGQRLVLVRLAIYHLTNISHHQAEHPEQTLSREDASLVIASTAALLSASIAQRFHPGEEEEHTG